MSRARVVAVGVLSLAGASLVATDASSGPAYPKTRRESISERRFGVTYHDAYRWMENLDDPDLTRWVNEQNSFTEATLAGADFDALRQEFEAMLTPVEPETEAERRFQRGVRKVLRTRRLPVVEETESTLEAFSPSGGYQVTGTSDSGSDFTVLRVVDLATGHHLPDTLLTKGAQVLWDSDDSFLYATDRDGRLGDVLPIIRRHKLKTLQQDDSVVFVAPKPNVWVDLFQVAGRYLLAQSFPDGSTTYDELDIASGALTRLVGPTSGTFTPAAIDGEVLYFVDYRAQPLGEITTLDLTTGQWTTIVRAEAHALDSAALVGDQLFVSYLVDTESQIKRVDLRTRAARSLTLPASGRATMSWNGSELRFAVSSYTARPAIWRYDVAADRFTLETASPTAPLAVDATKVFYTAHNGRPVPVWVIRRQGLTLTADTPMYLYGYGGFRVNILPSYLSEIVPWLKRGGAVAIVTLPGGMEYGEEWHAAGALFEKRNVFDDFAAAARHLISIGWTRPDKLALAGTSNGGLLVGATMNLYPDLFRAAVPEVGVLDFTKFQLFTSGKWWIEEYGDRDNRASFQHLYSLSPYHQLKPRRYPATLVMTADSDDRVVPSHSFKYAARLQSVQSDDRLALLHVRRGGSHSWRTGTIAEQAKARAVKWAFLMKELGL